MRQLETGKGIVLVVHPYGHVDESRHLIELRGLEQYFSAVVSFIREHQSWIKVIIVPGGMVKHGVVEADSVAAELRRRLEETEIDLPIETDAVPKSTIAIVDHAIDYMGEHRFDGCVLWETADNWRWLKTVVLSWLYRRWKGGRFKFRVFAFRRDDISSQSSHLRQFIELVVILAFGPGWVKRKIEADR